MAKLANLPALAIINGFKGTLDYYVHDGQPCVRKWPRSPGHQRAPAVMEQWNRFAQASRLWSQLSPEVQDAYRQNAAGTNLTARDLFTKSYIKGFIHLPR